MTQELNETSLEAALSKLAASETKIALKPTRVFFPIDSPDVGLALMLHYCILAAFSPTKSFDIRVSGGDRL